MRILRALGGGLLWIVASLLGVVAVVLCVTVILLPLGLPLLALSRRLFGTAVKLMLPRAVAHPVDAGKKSVRTKGRKAKQKASDIGAGDAVTKAGRRTRKKATKATRKTRKRLKA
jgi:hypothetical protein